MLIEKVRDLPVALTKTAAMRYIAETAGAGYFLYQTGIVPAEKLIQLIEKFDKKYRVLATRGMRDNDRQRGRSCAKLVIFPEGKPEGRWLFWLLATTGDGFLPLEKSTCDARNSETRLSWPGQYELVARPVRRRTGELEHVWTWVFAEKSLAAWQDRLKIASGRVRSSQEKKSDYLGQQVELLRKVPGFHGINRQKRALINGADIPFDFHEKLELKRLGTVVNKSLPVFEVGRTAVTVLQKYQILPEKI